MRHSSVFYPKFSVWIPSSASDEACTLEHAVSDETIDRLGKLIVTQDHQRHHGKGRHESGQTRTLQGETDEILPVSPASLIL